MITIQLTDLIIFGYHGLYPEERLVGASFRVDLLVSIPDPGKIIGIEDSISYEALFQIVSQVMAIPQALLEQVAYEVIAEIKKNFPQITEINITIEKKSPPIPNFQGRVAVSLHKHF